MWLGFLFVSQVTCNQTWSETPQFMTTKLDIRGIDSIEGYCFLEYSQLYSAEFEITHWIDNLFTTICGSHRMLMNRAAPNFTNMAPTGGLFRSQQHPDDNVGASVNNAGNTPSKHMQFGRPTKWFYLPLGYSYLPSQPPFPGAPQFYHPAPFNMTTSS